MALVEHVDAALDAGECIKALTSIKRGIDMLDERHRPASDDGSRPSGTDSIAVDAGEQAQTAPRP